MVERKAHAEVRGAGVTGLLHHATLTGCYTVVKPVEVINLDGEEIERRVGATSISLTGIITSEIFPPIRNIGFTLEPLVAMLVN